LETSSVGKGWIEGSKQGGVYSFGIEELRQEKA